MKREQVHSTVEGYIAHVGTGNSRKLAGAIVASICPDGHELHAIPEGFEREDREEEVVFKKVSTEPRFTAVHSEHSSCVQERLGDGRLFEIAVFNRRVPGSQERADALAADLNAGEGSHE